MIDVDRARPDIDSITDMGLWDKKTGLLGHTRF